MACYFVLKKPSSACGYVGMSYFHAHFIDGAQNE